MPELVKYICEMSYGIPQEKGHLHWEDAGGQCDTTIGGQCAN